MTVEFKNLNIDSKAWVFQSATPISDKKLKLIESDLNKFLLSWTAHGSELKTSYQFPYNQFIVIIVDHNKNIASGCSIDKLIHFIKKIETKFELILLDRFSIAYKKNEKINVINLNEFKKIISKNKDYHEVFVFNNMISSLKEFKNNWEIPLKKSYLNKYIRE